MIRTKDFYGSGKGDHLIDSYFFPKEIKQFLAEERRILGSLKGSFDFLIEIGSTHGCYLKWAVKNDKHYLGVDIVQRYIKVGRRVILDLQLDTDKYKFVLGGAEKITDLITLDGRDIEPNRCLLFFPFNSFGNMEDPLVVIKSIKASGIPFLISTYSTNQEASIYRERYYKNCGYFDIFKIRDEKGVRFVSSDGLSTIAYHSDYIQEIFISINLNVTIFHFSKIGVAFASPEIANNIIPTL
jgi:hypothetical protein